MAPEAGGSLSASRVRRTRIILIIEVAVAVIVGVVVHPILFVLLLLPIAELAVKPSSQRKQILGLPS